MVASREELLEQVETLSASFLTELRLRSADDPVNSATWPTVGALTGHVTAVYTWVTTILRTGTPVAPEDVPLDDASMVTTLREARDALLTELHGDDRDCWVIGGQTGSTAFWRRRMVLETLKHLLDLRTAPGAAFAIPTEFTPALAADGIDEFLEVFLARSRPKLAPLPGSVRLVASDAGRSWLFLPDWSVSTGHAARDEVEHSADATITAPAAALALLLWERASALREPTRFKVSGDPNAVQALESTPIHR